MDTAPLKRLLVTGMLSAGAIVSSGNEDYRKANLQLQAEADFVVHYHIDDRKLDVGMGKEDESSDRKMALFTLEELKGFFDEQKHKDLLFVWVEGHWLKDEQDREPERLRAYFSSRGYKRVEFEYPHGRGLPGAQSVPREVIDALLEGRGIKPTGEGNTPGNGAEKLQLETGGEGIMSDGQGHFPVVVVVLNADSATPVQGVSVKLVDVPAFMETELDPEKRLKGIPESLGKPLLTDERGCATLFTHGKFTSFDSGGTKTFNQQINGTLVVERNGKVVYRRNLADWAKEENYMARPNWAPVVTLSLK